jgi:two-component system sensor histidine kinase VicK
MMKSIRFFQSIQAKLIIIYVLLILVAMQLIGVYFIRTLDNYFKNDFIDTRNKQATLLAGFVESYLLINNTDDKPEDGFQLDKYEGLNDIVNNLIAISNAEIQIIDENGIVISSSSPKYQDIIGQKNTQTEVARALQGIKDNERIFVDQDGYRKLVIAKPIGSGVRVLGVVYIIASMEELYASMNNINQILLSGTLIALIFTIVLGSILSNTITKPIKEITQQATAVADGNFDQSVKIHGQDEIGQLAHTFNYMMYRLKEALSLNEEEREKLSSILTNMNDGIVASDEAGNVIVINRRANQLLGIQVDEVNQKNIIEMFNSYIKPPHEFILQENHIAYIEREQTDEEPLFIKVTCTAIHRRSYGITGWVAVLQDITEQQKLELSRREFVANVSHELRTPLTTLKSYLEALDIDVIKQPDTAERFILVAKSETERMIRLITDLLQLSRLDSKRLPLKIGKEKIPEIVDEVADRFVIQLSQKNINLKTDISTVIEEVFMDRDKIDQVLDNLMSNAIKYTPEQGRIQLSVYPQDEHFIEICVEDNGIGIPKKDLTRIFERFYRVDKARSRNMGGTGLGLSIAREIVKIHGGELMLESEYGKGTKAKFTLPQNKIEGDYK